MSLLGATDFPAIRLALDPSGSITTATLADATIALDVYQGQAERRVLALVPTAASLTGADQLAVKTAAEYFVAALLAERMPPVQRMKVGDVEETRMAQSLADWVALLEAEAFRALSQLTSGLLVNEVPTLFAVACGRRGY